MDVSNVADNIFLTDMGPLTWHLMSSGGMTVMKASYAQADDMFIITEQLSEDLSHGIP